MVRGNIFRIALIQVNNFFISRGNIDGIIAIEIQMLLITLIVIPVSSIVANSSKYIIQIYPNVQKREDA